MDAGCDEDLLVVATASVGFLVMATYYLAISLLVRQY